MVKWSYLLIVFLVHRNCEVAGQFNYAECENSICVGLPENCVTALNCLAIGKVTQGDSSALKFDVQTIPEASLTASPTYVAIALTLDSSMEHDSLIQCVLSTDKNQVLVSYTPQGSKSVEYNKEITVTHQSYTDGIIHCIFELQTLTVANNQTFDMNHLSYHLLLDMGNNVNGKYYLNDSWPFMSLDQFSVNPLSRQSNLASKPSIGPEIVKQLNGNIDYDGCGRVHTCFGIPTGCIDEKNCHTAVAITYTSPTYTFHAMTNLGTSYVAVALSDDRVMGDDSVIECVRENNGVNMYTSYTRVSYTGTDRHDANGVATLLNSSFVNGEINCYVERSERSTLNGRDFDLDNQVFYIMLAIGNDATATEILEHTERQVTSRAVLLQDPDNLTGANKPLLIRLHGCFMIVAWMGTGALGLVLARYFKNEWSGKQLFGKDLWFVGHMTCMAVTWILTLASFVIIFIHVGGWTKIAQTHGILGTIVTVLCFFQPIGAAFRPSPNHERRYQFNIGHYLIGRITFLLAIITIFYAIFISSAEIPGWFIAIMVVFVVVFWGNHILMGVMVCLTDGELGIFSLLRSLLGPAKRIDYKKGEYSAWYIRHKVTVFLIYLVVIIGLVITGILVVLIARK